MRTDNKATPGPWEYAQTGDDDDRFDIFQSKTSWTVARTVNNAHIDDREANARLIASAPELFEALTGLMSLIEFADSDGRSLQGDNMKEYRNKWEPCARAAIAKATAV